MRRFRRGLAVCFAFILCLSAGMTAYATETDQTAEEELTPEQQAEKEEQQRVYELPIQTNELTGWPQGPGTYGEAAIVMDAETGAILYAKNIDEHYYPASITKLLTTLVAMELGELEDEISFSEDSLSFLEWDDAYIGMKVGNVISLEQALHAVLLASANEVSYAVAESLGKKEGHDYSWYIEQMNEKCRELGGMNSHFVNPHGLHDDNHYTCARDMALIAKELYKYPKVFEIMQTPEYKITASDTTEEHVFQQNHKMLLPYDYRYCEYVTGGKTGYTDQALSTLVTMADNGQMKLICVLLKTRGVNVYTDTKNLFDYVYGNFTKIEIAGQETSEDVEKILTEDGGGYVILPAGVTFDNLDMELTPEEDGSGEATLTYTYEGNCVGAARAKLSEAYLEKNSIKMVSDKENNEEKTVEKKTDKKKSVLAAAIILLIVLIIALIICVIRRKRKIRARRRRRR